MRDPSCDFSYRKLKELRFQINFNVFATGIWNSKVKFPFFLKMNNFSMQHPSGKIVKFAPFFKKKFAHSFTLSLINIYTIFIIYINFHLPSTRAIADHEPSIRQASAKYVFRICCRYRRLSESRQGWRHPRSFFQGTRPSPFALVSPFGKRIGRDAPLQLRRTVTR